MYPRIWELREDSDFLKRSRKIVKLFAKSFSNYELGTRDVPISVLKQLAFNLQNQHRLHCWIVK